MSHRILYHHRIRADDGQAVHVREMIAALREAGHEVLECALVGKAGAPGTPSGGGGLWRGLSLPRLATECLEIAYASRGAAMIQRAARDFRPDFIYERHALHCDAGLRAARRLDLPLLLEVNSPMSLEMAELGLLRFPGLARRTERRVLGEADRVLAVSQVLAGILQGLGAPEDRLAVVRNGVDPRRHALEPGTRAAVRQALKLPEDAFAAVFVGYLRPWHRLDLVLHAMQHLADDGLFLVVVGEGPALAVLRSQARALGLAEHLLVPGAVGSQELPPLLAAMDAALLPAINSYASPLKLFDYLAAGLPCLAVDQPNIRELIEDGKTGLLLPAEDVDAIAAALHRLRGEPELADALGAAARAQIAAADWTWSGAARRVVQAYQEVAA